MKKSLFILSIVSILSAQTSPTELPPIHLENQSLPQSFEDVPIETKADLSIPLTRLEEKPLEMPLKKKSVFWAVTLASLYPGLGHVYLGNMQTAGGLSLSALTTQAIARSPHQDLDLRELSFSTLQNLSFYSVYSAYRDVRLFNGNEGYAYRMPNESLAELSLAPLNYKILSKKEVWGGILGSLAMASLAAYGYSITESAASSQRTSPLPIVALPVAVGEEAFFRGAIQPILTERFGPSWGIAFSSLLFGAAHIPNAILLEKGDRWKYFSFSLPLITIGGAYTGWLAYKNTSLKEAIALHAWYDFALFSLGYLAAEGKTSSPKSFALSIPF